MDSIFRVIVNDGVHGHHVVKVAQAFVEHVATVKLNQVRHIGWNSFACQVHQSGGQINGHDLGT